MWCVGGWLSSASTIGRRDVGSIRRRELGDGSPRYDVIYRDPDGKQRVKTFRLKRSAVAFGNKMETDKQRGDWIDPDAGRVTFGDYAREWVDLQTFDPSTRLAVENRLGVHVYPVIGGKQLRNIKPSTMQAWLRSVEDLAPRTRVLILGHVSAIFNAAVDDYLVARNPCSASSVRRPKVPTRKVVPWEHSQVLAVREALPDRYRVIAMLGAGLGLRQGEVFGLSPDDIDWLRGTVQVRRQVKLVGPHQVFGPPKYGREREVPLPESVRAYLAAYLAVWPARAITLPWRSHDSGKEATALLMATTRERTVINRSYFNGRIWKPALREAGLPVTRANGTHALRHFYASALLDGGESIRAVSEYLGHADPGFTLRVYTHLMPSSAERTRNAIDAVFRVEDAPSDVTPMSQEGA
jgi:integrase